MIQTAFHDLLTRVGEASGRIASAHSMASVGDRELGEAVRLAIHTHAMGHPSEPASKEPKGIEIRKINAGKVVVVLEYDRRFGPETDMPIRYEYPVHIQNKSKDTQDQYHQLSLF